MLTIKGLSLTLVAVLMTIASAVVVAGDTPTTEHSNAEYCDFRLYAPDEAESDTGNLLLERSDLNNMFWAEEDGWLYWYIEVADHARDEWEQVISESVGLSISIYCGDELIANPTIRAPLGYEFKIAGLESNQRRWQ